MYHFLDISKMIGIKEVVLVRASKDREEATFLIDLFGKISLQAPNFFIIFEIVSNLIKLNHFFFIINI